MPSFCRSVLMLILFVFAFVDQTRAQWSAPSASPQLPQFIVAPGGQLFLKADPEYRPPFRFRCITAVVSTSCTTLHPDLVDGDGGKAIAWVRKIILAALREGGADPYRTKLRFEFSSDLGLMGGYFAVVTTETAPEGRALNALWPPLWFMLPGETEATVKQRIRDALRGGY